MSAKLLFYHLSKKQPFFGDILIHVIGFLLHSIAICSFSDWTQYLKPLCMPAPNAYGSLPSGITEKNRQVCAWRDERGVWHLCWIFEVWVVMRERCVDVEAGCLCGLLDKSLGLFPLCEHYCSTTKLLCISACPFRVFTMFIYKLNMD